MRVRQRVAVKQEARDHRDEGVRREAASVGGLEAVAVEERLEEHRRHLDVVLQMVKGQDAVARRMLQILDRLQRLLERGRLKLGIVGKQDFIRD